MSGLTPYNVLETKMCDSDENCIWQIRTTMKNDESDEQMVVCQGVYISKMKMMKLMRMMKIIVI